MDSAMVASTGGPATRGGCQGDAVGNRESGDRRQQTPPATNDEQQRQHEQQVIEAEQNVRDTQLQVLPGHRPRRGRFSHLHRGTGRLDQLRENTAVRLFDADQHVAERLVETGKVDALTGQTAGAAIDQATLQQGVAQVRSNRRHDITAHGR